MLKPPEQSAEVDQSMVDYYFSKMPEPLFPVSVVHKVIHIHIPKTAGTSIRRAIFGSEVIKHVKAGQIDQELWENLPSLTIVRHPMERFISNYKYHVESKYGGILMKRNPDLKSLSLTAYAERFVGTSALLESQKSYIHRSDSAKSTVDYLIRFEDIATELPRVFKELHINLELEKVKVGSKAQPEVPEEVKKIVEDYYAEDYELFGY